jgi:hypothetical protein
MMIWMLIYDLTKLKNANLKVDKVEVRNGWLESKFNGPQETKRNLCNKNANQTVNLQSGIRLKELSWAEDAGSLQSL